MDPQPNVITNELVQRVAEGDESAFAILYRYLLDGLRPVQLRAQESGVDAKEIMQLTFVKVWLNREQLPTIDNLDAWVFTIAYREYLMAIRKKISYNERLGRFGSQQETGFLIAPPSADYEELKRLTLGIIEGLAPQRKLIYQLSRQEGLRVDEIAERLKLSPNTVKTVLQIVLKIIREKLTEYGYGPFAFYLFYNFFIF